jgi:hypothetical protein
MQAQPFEPGELVVELRAGLRIAVRSVDRGDEDAPDRRLDVAALEVGRVAWQFGAHEHRVDIPREDRDPVPGRLAAPYGAVAGGFDRSARKISLGDLQLLQADDVGFGGAEPVKEVVQTPLDAVDVECGDPHAITP